MYLADEQADALLRGMAGGLLFGVHACVRGALPHSCSDRCLLLRIFDPPDNAVALTLTTLCSATSPHPPLQSCHHLAAC